MGLGKTIQALALIVSRRSRYPAPKTTLIVAPLALLRQWEKEIASKIKPSSKLDTMILHGEDRWTPLSILLEHDIVLCTYGVLRSEHQNLTNNLDPTKLRVLDPRAVFHRVILDEAHNIKNPDAQVSRAAAALKACYRLCMTGTPLMNCATEIFPLIRFLNIGPYNDWAIFNTEVNRPIMNWRGNEDDEGMRKFQALIRDVMLRRTKTSVLDGKPILELPPRVDLVAYAQFDEEQNKYYRALELQQRLRFNKYLKAGTVMKNYVYILVLLLRLRQACDHPHLIKDQAAVEGADLDNHEMRDLAMTLADRTVAAIMSLQEFECLMCHGKPDNPIHIHPCGHHICAKCFAASVKTHLPEAVLEELDNVICPHDGCEVQITPRNIFLRSSFIEAYPAARKEADNQDLDVMGIENYIEDDFGAILGYDGPVDEPESEHRQSDDSEPDICNCKDCGCEDCESDNCECKTCKCGHWEGTYDGLFMEQHTEPGDQPALTGEQPSINDGNADLDGYACDPPFGVSNDEVLTSLEALENERPIKAEV